MNSIWLLLSATTVVRVDERALVNWTEQGNPGDVVVCLGAADAARFPSADVAQMRARRNVSFLTFLIAREDAPTLAKRMDQDVTSFACDLGVLQEVVRWCGKLLPSAYDVAAYLMADGPCDWIDCMQIPLRAPVLAPGNPGDIRPGGQEWIIPHRGAQAHLRACVKSVLRARHADDIVSVVLDDEPGQERTVTDVAAPGLRYFRPEPCDIGPYIAREMLSARSGRELLLFQDSDDMACSNRSSVLRAAMGHGELDWLGSHELRFDEIEQRLFAVRMPIDVSAAMQQRPSSEYLLFPSTAIRNEALRRAGGFSTVLKFGGDGELLFRAAFSIRIGNVDEFLYIRRQRFGSLTKSPGLELGGPVRNKLYHARRDDSLRIARGETSIDQSELAVKHSELFFKVVLVEQRTV